eukprot:gb/GECG01012365.1/.p1 GENE.gb/GECG01012365.1/~~gb/GECG01012365.1/.p1  ORF type:complete len:378 (+),score=52.67 gb/GECG01012365.1/:1-1134(+)
MQSSNRSSRLVAHATGAIAASYGVYMVHRHSLPSHYEVPIRREGKWFYQAPQLIDRVDTLHAYNTSSTSTQQESTTSDTEGSLVTSDSLKEHRTYQEFPFILNDKKLNEITDSEATGQNSFPRMYLAGTALRCMLGWCKIPHARAYAYGLYFDLPSVENASEVDDYGSGADIVERVLDAKTADAKTGNLCIMLRMARDIDGNHIARGFQNSVDYRIKQAQKEWEKEQADETVSEGSDDPSTLLKIRAGETEERTLPLASQNQLLSYPFKGRQFREGDVVIFLWASDGNLYTFCQDHWCQESFSSPALARALFDVYCGNNPVSERGKNTFVYDLSAMAHEFAKLGVDAPRGGLTQRKKEELEASIIQRVTEQHNSRSK